jgi:hypothetical protein
MACHVCALSGAAATAAISAQRDNDVGKLMNDTSME